ncbi:uncharacterized protein LOC144654152 [Oculina patagonica]
MSKEELKHNRAVRGAYKGHCNQDIKRAERLMTDTEGGINITELKAIGERLSRRLDEIKAMDTAILNALQTDEEISEETEQALTFQDDIHYWIVKIKEFVTDGYHPVSTFQNKPTPRAHTAHINLPKLQIHPFDGNPLEWLTFWDSYSNAVHNNQELNNIDKMNYLKGLITCNAARAISGLPMTSQNYEKAIEILKERFGRNQVLINAHMESLSKISAPSADVQQLRQFYDSCESNIRALETLGVQTDSYGSLLIPILLKKLPEQLRCTIFRTNPQADCSLNDLRTALCHEIDTREKSQLTQENDTSSVVDDVLVPTVGALLTNTQPRQIHPAPKSPNTNRKFQLKPCIYCDGKHRHDKCSKVKTTKERKTILTQKNKCLNCLRSGHTRYQCQSRFRCLNCGLKHHTSICEPSEPNRDSSKRHEKQEDPQNSKNVTSAMTTLASTTIHTNTLMQTALVTASGPTTRCQARILIDTGSQKTFITQCLKNKLQLKAAQNEILDVTTFGSTKGTLKSYEVVTLTLNAVNKDVKITALVTPIICPPLSSTQHMEIPVEFKALAFADPLNAKGDRTIDILIGNDHYAQVILGNTKKSQDERWMATQSKFGWLLSGPVPNNEFSTETTLNTLCQMIDAQPTRNDDLNETLTKFWEISKIPDECNDTEVTGVQKHFQDTIEFNKVTGRYNVILPWKDNKQNLPTNFTLARKRLSNLQHTLKGKHPELIHKYNEQLLDQLKRGFIEQVLDPNIHQGVMHYMPHFPVFKESNTTAMRIVYDASAKISSKALSLNDCLHTGPNLIQRLQNMLLTFRSHKIAFTADIEKAFLQIELNTQDRDATRFLWLKDIDKSANNPDNLVVYRFCRVLFGAAPSPYLLNATIQHHLAKQDDWISEDLQRSIYMDNVVTGTDTEPEALQYYTSSRNYFQGAGMNLRQWTSNSPTLNRQAHDDGVYAEPMVKVLGLNWNTKTDTLSLSLAKLIKQTNSIEKVSKRSVLSLSSKLYDPLGFVEPVTVKAKIMMQELWKQNLKWDEELPGSFKENWVKWLNELQNLTPLGIPRQYFNNDGGKVQLHVFCDSSQLAYGAVAYLRGTKPKSETKCTFTMSKSKVAPIKPQTMPRLELLAAVLGAELSKYLSNTILSKFHTSEIILWSDSQIVLSWITSSKPLRQQFIQHRVQRIRDITSQSTWMYCPTSCNPADLITRGLDANAFISKQQIWNQGSAWLMKPTREWPTVNDNQLQDNTENYTETQAISINVASTQKSPNLLNVIDITKYSTLNKTLRVTALVIHFTRKLREKTKSNTITAIDMKHARNALLQSVQQFYYGEILSKIKDKGKGKRPAIIHQLGLYLDDDVLLRCRGRLQYAQLPHNTKFPILIPKESHLSTLIVRATHSIVLHGGVRETLTELRQSYWIPKGRQLVKREIRKCVTCRKVEGPPFRSVSSPPLPDIRVTGSQPFQVTGIDYAGPLYVRNANKEVAKVYICLFTCTTIRAVHLELVEDQTASAFLRAFKRFASRRGIPECIISDNAKTFKQVHKN